MGRIEATELESFARSVVESWDTPPDVAADIAASLVVADLTGHGSHGVCRLATLSPECSPRVRVPHARLDV